MARSVEDIAVMLDVIGGWHPADPFSVPAPATDYVAATRRGGADLSIQYSPDLGIFPMTDAIRTTTDEAIAALESTGASVTHRDPDLGHNYKTLLEAWEEGLNS